jgi:hypothetical protein
MLLLEEHQHSTGKLPSSCCNAVVSAERVAQQLPQCAASLLEQPLLAQLHVLVLPAQCLVCSVLTAVHYC